MIVPDTSKITILGMDSVADDLEIKSKLAPKAIVGARGSIVYLFCLIATPLLVLFSNIIHMVKPEMFAAVPVHILPYGILLVAVFLPIEFLIFYLFETQKADIIAALACFPYMGLMFLLHKYFLSNSLWIAVLVIAVFTNIVCFKVCLTLYENKRI